jgi:signal peptidase I
MICGNFHVTQLPNVAKLAHSGDRILVAKFLTPQRWDLVVFQYPENPSLVYVDRLVGMPGEEILVRDGSVWGSAERPALLGDDEYFVLGDFSAQSNDSRMWKKGAAGHNPFAVPESHLIGVVTHIYWPLDRWRIFR